MRLIPKGPPGRVNRKALAFEAEICRLRSEGYTCEAIREALSDAGVQVSKSTVQREVARLAGRRQLIEPNGRVNPSTAKPPAPPTLISVASGGFLGDARSGKEIAESFVKNRVTNPLFRLRSSGEGSGH